MLVPAIGPPLARASFEMARRAFARHFAGITRTACDPRHLADLHALAAEARVLFAASELFRPAVHDSELERMSASMAAVQRARSVSRVAPEVLATLTLARGLQLREHVLAPQSRETKRPELLTRVVDTFRDVVAFSQASGGAADSEGARARLAAEQVAGERERVQAERERLSRDALTDALIAELDAALSAAERAQQVRVRVLQLDRAHEAQRQLVFCAPPPVAFAVTQAALRRTRALGFEPSQGG